MLKKKNNTDLNQVFPGSVIKIVDGYYCGWIAILHLFHIGTNVAAFYYTNNKGEVKSWCSSVGYFKHSVERGEKSIETGH